MNDLLLTWLLEPGNPSARYLTLRDLLDRPADDDDVVAARAKIEGCDPVQAILHAQYPAGYWIKPGRGYSPKYKATIWQLIFLADLGIARTTAIARACEHVMTNALRTDHGLFSAHKHSTGIFPCLNGDLLRALHRFGYGDHPTVHTIVQSLAQRTIVDGFICPRNSIQVKTKATWRPCVWGCVKVLRGFAAIPVQLRSLPVRRAVRRGVAFTLSQDLTQDLCPGLVKSSVRWQRFGFPSRYGSDLLEALLALTELGVPGKAGRSKLDRSRLSSAIQIVLDKRDAMGRWPLEHALRNTWADLGAEGKANKWVTLRALRVLAPT
jgi:hypothetical protein